MRKENHQWVGSLRWIRTNDDSVTYDVHLGETVYIDGLGAVTLLQVNPPPLFFDDQQSGGWDYEAYSWGVGEYDSEDGCDGFWEGL